MREKEKLGQHNILKCQQDKHRAGWEEKNRTMRKYRGVKWNLSMMSQCSEEEEMETDVYHGNNKWHTVFSHTYDEVDVSWLFNQLFCAQLCMYVMAQGWNQVGDMGAPEEMDRCCSIWVCPQKRVPLKRSRE